MDSSILIRTLVFDKNSVSLQAGGGITAESDPEEEYQETLHKARALIASFKPNRTVLNTDVNKVGSNAIHTENIMTA